MNVTIQGTLIELSDLQKADLDNLMRIFESAFRFAYARWCEGLAQGKIEKLVASTFGINSRWAKDATAKAKASFESSKEQVKEGRLESPEKVIWGGRKNFEKRAKGQITQEEWKRLRQRQFWSRGDRSKNGNLNTRILPSSEKGYYDLRVSHGLRNWKLYKLWVPPKFRERLNHELDSEYGCYTVRVKRCADNRYRVHITFDDPDAHFFGFDDGVIGIDLNPSGIGWAETNSKGQPLNWGWIPTEILMFARKGKRDNVAQLIAIQIAEMAAEKGKGVVLEGLGFDRGKKKKKKPEEKNNKGFGRKLNRIFNNFVYRKLGEAISRQCIKRLVGVKCVNPAFTSVIGKLKYMPTYKFLRDHQAAAYVIARRGQGFQDMPKGEMRVQGLKGVESRKSRKFHPWTFWRILNPRRKKKSAHSGTRKSSRTMREGKRTPQGRAKGGGGGTPPASNGGQSALQDLGTPASKEVQLVTFSNFA